MLISFVTVFIVFFLVACNNDNASVDEKETDSGQDVSEGLNIVDGKIEPAVKITTVLGEDPTAKFKNGESYKDNVHLRWAKEQLGVDIEVLWTSPVADGSYLEKLKLGLASGDELPDVFKVNDKQTLDMFIESGLVLDVGTAFEKYASDTWKAAMAEVEPHAWHPFIRGDKKYAIPVINQNAGARPVMWIRQDWLNNLGLEAPKNLEEFEALLEAFANQDPDGNGQDDTIALELAAKDGFTTSPIGDASWIFGLFGAIPERWYPNEDGQLEYGSIQPEIKEALQKLKEWKEKGYISNEIALSDFNTVSTNVISGKVGIIGGEPWLMVYPGGLMLQSNPTALYTPYVLPEGANGPSIRKIANPFDGAILINKDISEEALQAFFHYQNKLYSAYESDDPFIFKGYQEGYDYVIEDGKAVLNEEKIPGGKISTMKYTLVGGMLAYPSKQIAVDEKIVNGEELTNNDLATMANSGIIGVDETLAFDLETFTRQATVVSRQQESANVPEYFKGPTTRTMSQRGEMLSRLETDTFINIIYGRESIDSFDKFVDEWYSSGGEKVKEEVNEWYESVK